MRGVACFLLLLAACDGRGGGAGDPTPPPSATPSAGDPTPSTSPTSNPAATPAPGPAPSATPSGPGPMPPAEVHVNLCSVNDLAGHVAGTPEHAERVRAGGMPLEVRVYVEDWDAGTLSLTPEGAESDGNTGVYRSLWTEVRRRLPGEAGNVLVVHDVPMPDTIVMHFYESALRAGVAMSRITARAPSGVEEPR